MKMLRNLLLSPAYIGTISRIAASLLLAAALLSAVAVSPLRAQGLDYSWQPSSEGLSGATGTTFGFALNGNVVVGTRTGIFLLRNGEAVWQKTSVRSEVTHITTTHSGAMLAGTIDGTFRSTDNGETWQVNFVLSGQTNFVAAADTLLFAAQGGSFFGPPSYYFKSTDDGKTWSTLWVQDVRGGENWIILNAKKERLMTSDSGLMISRDYGKSWKPTGFTPFIYRILAPSPTLLTATTQEGVWQSADNGTSWQKIDTMPFNDVQVAPNGNYFYRLSGNASAWQAYTRQGIYRSTDNGISRSRILAGINPTGLGISPGGTIWVSANRGILRSTDNGETWERYDRGISNVLIADLEYSSSGDLFALAGSGYLPSQNDFFALYRSTDNGGSWSFLRDSLDNTLLIATPNGSLFATRQMVDWKPHDSLQFVDSGTVALLRSSDRGATWAEVAAEGSTTCLAYNSMGTIAAGFARNDRAMKSVGGDVAFSVNGGGSWQTLTGTGGAWSASGASKPVNSVAILENNAVLFSVLSTQNDTLITEGGLYRINADGALQTLAADRLVMGIGTAPDGSVLAAAATLFKSSPEEPFQQKDYGIYRSTDNGETWSNIYSLPFLAKTTFHFDGNTLAFATLEGTAGFRSVDNGLTWTEMKSGQNSLPLTDYLFHSSGSIFGRVFNSVQYSIDKGRTWYPFGNGLPSGGATALVISAGDDMLCGTPQHGIYRVERTTGVGEENVKGQNESQNGIGLLDSDEGLQRVVLSLHSSGFVSLSLHDLLGRRVAVLLDRQFEAGRHTTSLDLSGLTAGTYLLVLNGPDGLFSEKIRIR